VTLAVLAAAAMLFISRPRLARRRHERRDDTVAYYEMTALGISAGMTFSHAAAMAADEIGGDIGAAATRMLRGRVPDQRLSPLFELAGRTAQSGAPLLPGLDARIAELRAAERYAHLERVRKLPVKLLFPLALLVLPGFLLLTVGPVVAGSLQRLGL
jgi:hypothetical protein